MNPRSAHHAPPTRAYPLGEPFPRIQALDRAVAVEALVATGTLVLVVLGAVVAMISTG